jgi:hypothetical protein
MQMFELQVADAVFASAGHWAEVVQEIVPPPEPQVPPAQGTPLAQVVPQLPQLEGSEEDVVQKPPHDVPGQESVSPEACILYSTSKFASAPVFEAHVEPVRKEACRTSPAANVITIAPVSDQLWPGVRTRSCPLVLFVRRKTAAGQAAPVAVFATAAMRKTVIAWSRVNWPPTQVPVRLPG